jgi:hypothetical protein
VLCCVARPFIVLSVGHWWWDEPPLPPPHKTAAGCCGWVLASYVVKVLAITDIDIGGVVQDRFGVGDAPLICHQLDQHHQADSNREERESFGKRRRSSLGWWCRSRSRCCCGGRRRRSNHHPPLVLIPECYRGPTHHSEVGKAFQRSHQSIGSFGQTTARGRNTKKRDPHNGLGNQPHIIQKRQSSR